MFFPKHFAFDAVISAITINHVCIRGFKQVVVVRFVGVIVTGGDERFIVNRFFGGRFQLEFWHIPQRFGVRFERIEAFLNSLPGREINSTLIMSTRLADFDKWS